MVTGRVSFGSTLETAAWVLLDLYDLVKNHGPWPAALSLDGRVRMVGMNLPRQGNLEDVTSVLVLDNGNPEHGLEIYFLYIHLSARAIV